MKITGLTGPTGAGKSVVADVARELGFCVIDCDAVVRHEQTENRELLLAIERAFCGTVKDGVLDRRELARCAFSSKENTQKLNKTVLPFIEKKINTLMTGENILLDAPTLFDSGLYKKCDIIISVTAEREARKERIKNRDGLSEDAALLRISAARDDEFFIKNSHAVIVNNGTAEELKTQAEELLSRILTEGKV